MYSSSHSAQQGRCEHSPRSMERFDRSDLLSLLVAGPEGGVAGSAHHIVRAGRQMWDAHCSTPHLFRDHHAHVGRVHIHGSRHAARRAGWQARHHGSAPASRR